MNSLYKVFPVFLNKAKSIGQRVEETIISAYLKLIIASKLHVCDFLLNKQHHHHFVSDFNFDLQVSNRMASNEKIFQILKSACAFLNIKSSREC